MKQNKLIVQDINVSFKTIDNKDFKGFEFDSFKNEAGSNSFTLSPTKWIENTNVIGLISKVKMNYHIHTDSIKNHLIPEDLFKKKISYIYANEDDILNIALFGMTAKEWRELNPNKEGNIRDFATAEHLLILANLEDLNAEFIKENIDAKERLIKLNQIVIEQLNILLKKITKGQN